MITAQHLELAAMVVEAAGGLFNRLQYTLQRFKAPMVGRQLLHVVWTQLRREHPGQYTDNVDFYTLNDPSKFVRDHESELSVQPDWAKWIPWLGQELDRTVTRDLFGFLLSDFPKFIKWMRRNKPDVNTLDLEDLVAELRDSQDDPPPQGKTVHREPDGWTVQQLTTREQLDAEGQYLQHCVGSYYDEVHGGKTEIFSLRDPEGFPHVTIEYQYTWRAWRVNQIQARGNQFPAKHRDRLVRLMDTVFRGDPVGKILLGVRPQDMNLRLANLSHLVLDSRQADWSGADLSGATLNESSLNEVVMSGADLSDVHAVGVGMTGTDLTGADLSGADFSGAHMRNAILRDAIVINCNLTGALLVMSDLRGADLTDATLDGANLHAAKWNKSTKWPSGLDAVKWTSTWPEPDETVQSPVS